MTGLFILPHWQPIYVEWITSADMSYQLLFCVQRSPLFGPLKQASETSDAAALSDAMNFSSSICDFKIEQFWTLLSLALKLPKSLTTEVVIRDGFFLCDMWQSEKCDDNSWKGVFEWRNYYVIDQNYCFSRAVELSQLNSDRKHFIDASIESEDQFVVTWFWQLGIEFAKVSRVWIEIEFNVLQRKKRSPNWMTRNVYCVWWCDVDVWASEWSWKEW